MRKKYLVGISALLALCLQPLSAHQIWIQKADAGYEVAYGEKVTEPDPLPFAKIKYANGITENGFKDKLHVFNTPSADKPDAGKVTVIPFSDYSVILAGMHNGYYVAVEDTAAERGYTYLKNTVYGNIDDAGKKVVKRLASMKFAKFIAKWNSNLCEPLGQRLEIVPLQDVTTLQAGDTLRFKIFYEGKEVTGANTSIYKSSDPILPKEENPKMSIVDCSYQSTTVGAPGLQTVVVKHKVMLNEEGTKYISIASALSFYTK